MKTRYAVIDFETTGFSPKNGDRCIEAAVVLLQDGEIIDRYTSLMCSDVPVSETITRLTGIENGQLQEAPAAQSVIRDMLTLCRGSTLVAHNAAFDSRFWQNEVEIATGQTNNQQFLCTMKLARRMMQGRESYKLAKLGEEFGYDNSASHRAMHDAEVSAKLLSHIVEITASYFPTENVSPELLLKLQDTPIKKITSTRFSTATAPVDNLANADHRDTATLRQTSEAVTKNIKAPPDLTSKGAPNNSTKSPGLRATPLAKEEILRYIDDESVTLAKLETRRYKNGNISSYRVTLSHEELQANRNLSSKHIDVLCSKVRQQVGRWKSRARALAANTKADTQIAPGAMYSETSSVTVDALGSLLQDTLCINDAVDWNTLRHTTAFLFEPTYPQLVQYDQNGEPLQAIFQQFEAPKPIPENLEKPDPVKYHRKVSLWQRVTFQTSRIQRQNEQRYLRALQEWRETQTDGENAYREALQRWEQDRRTIDKNNSYIKIIFAEEQRKWTEAKQQFDLEANDLNASVDRLSASYNLQDTDAIEEYCDLVLERSDYPDFWQREAKVDYDKDKKSIRVDIKLPEIGELPKHAPKIHGSSGSYNEQDQINLYRSVIHQIMLRTLHEIFEADVVNAIKSMSLNGYISPVDSDNLDTCFFIAAVGADKESFNTIDLNNIDSTRLFQELGGQGNFESSGYNRIEPVVNGAVGVSFTISSSYTVSENNSPKTRIQSPSRTPANNSQAEEKPSSNSQLSEAWHEAIEFADEEFKAKLHEYHALGYEAPIVGLEICDANGAVTDLMLPVAWPERMFALVSTEAEQTGANTNGWTTILVNDKAQTESTQV